MSKNIKVSFIGSGNIAPFHIRALKVNKFKIISFYSRNLAKAKKFSFKNNIVQPSNTFSNFLKNSKNCDMFVIVVKTEAIAKYLNKIYKLDKFVFIEKPGSLFYKKLQKFSQNKKIYIGYNRRFYKNILKLKKIVKKVKSFNAIINITESSVNRAKIIKLNSVHVFDICFFLFGHLDVISFKKSKDTRSIKNFTVDLEDKNQNRITINFLFDAPINQNLSIFFKNILYKLEPIEKLLVYKNFKIFNPTKNIPYRRYVPLKKFELSAKIEKHQKPGFVEQYKELKLVLSKDKKSQLLCNLNDGMKNLKFAEKIVKMLT